MPVKDPIKRREIHQRWMSNNIKLGYGKWLYARRKLFRTDAEEFRKVLEEISQIDRIDTVRLLASKALRDADQRLKELGTWTEKRVLKEVSPDPEKGKTHARRTTKKSAK